MFICWQVEFYELFMKKFLLENNYQLPVSEHNGHTNGKSSIF